MVSIRSRHAEPLVLEALADTRAVVVQGARQVGKTTMVASVTERLGGRLVSLDDAQTRNAASTPPSFSVRDATGSSPSTRSSAFRISSWH
jgi:uncharacterized protein